MSVKRGFLYLIVFSFFSMGAVEYYALKLPDNYSPECDCKKRKFTMGTIEVERFRCLSSLAQEHRYGSSLEIVGGYDPVCDCSEHRDVAIDSPADSSDRLTPSKRGGSRAKKQMVKDMEFKITTRQTKCFVNASDDTLMKKLLGDSIQNVFPVAMRYGVSPRALWGACVYSRRFKTDLIKKYRNNFNTVLKYLAEQEEKRNTYQSLYHEGKKIAT